MKTATTILGICFSLCFLFPNQGLAQEKPPELVRTAPLIPWARSVGEHRYRSPRNYEDTLKYYRKVLYGEWKVAWKKIINITGIRAQHIKNKKKTGRWEGLNIYEHKGATYIYIVFSDEELRRIAEHKRRKMKKKQE